MSNLRTKVELLFINFGRLLCRRRWAALFMTFLVALAMTSQLPKSRFDTSAEGLLHPDDPAITTFDSFREQFGSDQQIIVMLEPTAVFDFAFLKKLKTFHEELEESVHVADVKSLVNVTLIQGRGDELLVHDLLDEWPENEGALADLKNRVLSNSLYVNSVISKDGHFTTVTIEPDLAGSDSETDALITGFAETTSTSPPRTLGEQEISDFYDGIREISSRYNSPDFPVHLGGVIAAEEVMKRMTRDTMIKFTLITTGVMLFFLAILFRRFSGIILPLVVVNLALYCTLGLMAFFNIPFTLNTTVMPSLIMAVGIGDAVHILAVFYLHFQDNGDKNAAIAFALGHSGLAVVMTSLTTAAGLLSFTSAGIAPIAYLGIFGAVGVMLALFFSLVLLPTLLAILPVRQRKSVSEKTRFPLDRLLLGIGNFSVRYPKKIVAASCVIFALALILALNLRFTHNSLLYLDPANEVRQAIELIDAKMKGSATVEVIIDTGQENGLYDPTVMQALDTMNRHAETMQMGEIAPGKSSSLVDIVKEIHRALNEDREDFFTVPEDRRTIAQELFLFENSGTDDLEKLVDPGFSKARMTIMVPWQDAVLYADVIDQLEVDLQEILGDRAQVTFTGLTTIICRTFAEIIRTMGQSYLIAGVVITGFMLLLIGNFKIGILSMAPNFLPIIIGLGFMKLANVPLDYSTIMVGGIAIGLAVDDTVHFFHNFRRYYDQTGRPAEAVRMTMQTTGRALLFTTLILSATFFSLLAAEMKSTVNFGLVTGVTIVMALIADFFLAPALLVLVVKSKQPAQVEIDPTIPKQAETIGKK